MGKYCVKMVRKRIVEKDKQYSAVQYWTKSNHNINTDVNVLETIAVIIKNIRDI